MLPTFRNPMQARTLDHVTLRREQKLLLPADVILDPQEWDELLDFSNQSARLNVLRKACIAARRAGLTPPRLLSEQERLALARYIQGDAPRPPFARFASRDGHYGTSYLASDDPDAPKAGPAWPEQSAREPGRYVEPTGAFAIPSDRGAS